MNKKKTDCLFCQIAGKKIKSELVWEDSEFVVFRDIHPKAPEHVLIVPRKHIKSVNDIEQGDFEMMGKIFGVIKEVANKLEINDAYQLRVNNGAGAGQVIDHLHVHLLGGWKSKQKG